MAVRQRAGVVARERFVRDPWFLALLGTVVLCIPVIVWGGRDQWFWLDEWDFILDRDLSDPWSILRPWWGHCVALPAVAFRVLFEVFGLDSYRPYQALAITGHVAVVVMVWATMRRLGVRGWVATAAAVPLLLLGSGRENIVWGFQVTMTGSLALGLAHLLLADHEGGRPRRDLAGVACGFAALLFSGVAVATIVGVGASVLVRRGWRPAVWHTVPLGLAFVTWSVLTEHDDTTDPVLGWEAVEFTRHLVGATFHGLGQHPVVGGALGVLYLVGLGSALASIRRARRDAQLPLAVGVATAALAFTVLVSVQRADMSEGGVAVASRYVYLLAMLVCPFVALAVERAARRGAVVAVALLGLLAAGVPGNVRALDDLPDAAAVFAATFTSNLLADAPGDHPVLFLDVATLRRLEASGVTGDFPTPEPAHQLTADGLLALGQAPLDRAPDCPVVPSAERSVAPGDTVLVTGDVDVVLVDGDVRSLPIRFRNVPGTREIVVRAPLTLQITGRDGGAVFEC